MTHLRLFLILSRNLAFHFCLPPFDTYQHFDNFAVRSLSGDYDVPPGEMTTQHLEKAKGGASKWWRGGFITYHTSWMVFFVHLSFRFGLEIYEIEDCLEEIGCDIVCSNHGKQEYGLCFSWVLHNVHSDTGNPVETPRLPRIWLKKRCQDRCHWPM